MSSVVINGDTSGSITLQAPAVAGTNTLTLPANTGTVLTSASSASDLPSSIKGPAFSAYLSSNQTISANTNTAVAFNTKTFDTGGCYNNTGSTVTLNGLSVPAYSFCPNIAGYYQITITLQPLGAGISAQSILNKNGSTVLAGPWPNTGTSPNIQMTGLVYLNGTGDYATGYVYSTGTSVNGNIIATVFQAVMVRSA